MRSCSTRTLRRSPTTRRAVIGAALVVGLSFGVVGASIALGSCADRSASASSVSPAPAGPAAAPMPTGPVANGHPKVIAIAIRFLGYPSVRGAASPSVGFDGSGLVMYCYAQIGIQLPHSSRYQQNLGVPVPLKALVPGDLVFKRSPSYQVAMYAGNGKVIVAPRMGGVVKYGTLAGWRHAVRLP
jgi:cell wall-associated NlpC family hydrolase